MNALFVFSGASNHPPQESSDVWKTSKRCGCLSWSIYELSQAESLNSSESRSCLDSEDIGAVEGKAS